MSEMKYDRELLDTVNRLTSINNAIVFKSEGDKIKIGRKSAAGSLGYILTCNKDRFDFEGDDVAIANYSEFNKLLNVYKNPSIKQAGSKNEFLVLCEGNSKIKYKLSESSYATIQEGELNEVKINFTDVDCEFRISKEQLKNFVKMIGLLNMGAIKDSKTRITIENDEVKFKLESDNHDNTFEESFQMESPVTEKIELVVTSETFLNIPEKDYKIEIKEEGYIRFEYVQDDVVLHVYTGTIDED